MTTQLSTTTVHQNLKEKRAAFLASKPKNLENALFLESSKQLPIPMISLLTPVLLLSNDYVLSALSCLFLIFLRTTLLYQSLWKLLCQSDADYLDIIYSTARYITSLFTACLSYFLSVLYLYTDTLFSDASKKMLLFQYAVFQIGVFFAYLFVHTCPFLSKSCKHFFSSVFFALSAFTVIPNVISLTCFFMIIFDEEKLPKLAASLLKNRVTETSKIILNPNGITDDDIRPNCSTSDLIKPLDNMGEKTTVRDETTHLAFSC